MEYRIMTELQTGLYIEVTDGMDKGRIIALHAYRIALGRRFKEGEKKKGWILFSDPSIHRTHAVLDWDKNRFILLNKDPHKRTLVNQAFCDSMPVAAGDRVRLGAIEFSLRDSLSPEELQRCEYVALYIKSAPADRAQGDEEIDRLSAIKTHRRITPQFTTISPQPRQSKAPESHVPAPVGDRVQARRLHTGEERRKQPPPDFYFLLFRGNLKLSRYPFYIQTLPPEKSFWLIPGTDGDEPPRFETEKNEGENGYLFELYYRSGRFLILSPREDQVRVNKRSVSAGETLQLRTGDEIKCNHFRMIFIEHQVLEELNRWELQVINGVPADHEKRFAVKRESLSIGRGKSCDIALGDIDLALLQATLHYTSHRFFIVQRSTSRMTCINTTPLKAGREKHLREGDLIRLGTATTLKLARKAKETTGHDE
jgi:predicted component of type VI protein secretion system